MRGVAVSPEHSLESIADIQYGFTAKAHPEPIGPKFLRITDIQSGNVDWSAVPFCEATKKERQKFALSPGEIVFARTGATTGKSYLIKDEVDAVFASYLIRVKPRNESICSQYLAYYFQTDEYWAEITAGTEGAAQGGFNASKLGQLKIPVPSAKEQKRIVAVLDQAFAALDRARAHAEANLADAAALLLNWVSAVFAADKNTWPKKGLAEICENLDRLRVPITKSDREAGAIPYYGASGIVDHVATHIFDEDLLLVSEDGANLLARTYPIAFSITGKAWVNNHAHVLRFEDLDTQEFVRLYLNSISLEPFVSGMAQPKLNQKALNSISVPFPDIAEQRRIVGQAREIGEASERARISYDLKLIDIANLRQSLLQKAFSGELT